MPVRARSKSKSLIVVAHPDDETLFFGGLMQSKRDRPWTVVCMTDGNADGDGANRRRQFEKACRLQGVKEAQWWAFADVYERRLDVAAMIERLQTLPKAFEIYTHGIIGEYGHPHHQDVSYAVHRAFPTHSRIYSSAYNVFPEKRIQLNAEVFSQKASILANVYGSETTRFLNLLPATSTEGFVRVGEREIEAIYDYVARGKPLRAKDLRIYRWLDGFLRDHRDQPRPF